jgi:thiosulfate/3-mercaptopyruvate sulfurtransferase
MNLPWLVNVQADGRFRPPAEIARRYVEAGGNQDAVLYCGSGITATLSLLALESAGLGATALYPGSWSDWIRDSSRPIATGTAP